MNLKKACKSDKIVDARVSIKSFSHDFAISPDKVVEELNQFLSKSEKEEFLKHCDDYFDLAENLNNGDLVDYVNDQLGGAFDYLLSEYDSYASSDAIKEFVNSYKRLHDVEDSASIPASTKLLKFLAEEE